MSISRYEESKNEAMKAIRHAICEKNYYCEEEYLVAVQNVTDNYNVDFTHTYSGEWADVAFEQGCGIARDCANAHKDTKYIVIFAKSYQSGLIEFIKEYHVCIASNKQNDNY